MHELELFLAGVTGNVHLRQRFIDHIRALAQQLVNDARDRKLVAGDGVCGNHNHIRRTDVQLAVLGERHAGQARHLLSLRAGGDDHDFVIRIAIQIVNRDHHVIRNVQFAQLHGHSGNIGHAAAGQADLTAVLLCRIDHLLNSVDVGGEHRDDDAPLGAREERVEGLPNLLFRHGIAGTLDISGIHQQRQHAALAQLRQLLEIHQLSVHRGVVHLEVAGKDHRAHRALDGHRDRARDGVAHLDEVHVKRADLFRRTGNNGVQRDVGHGSVLLELELDQRQRQPRAVNRHHAAQLLDHIGDRADMILVAVGNENAADLVAVALQIGHVRNHQINAQHILLREDGTAVQDHDIVRIFQHIDIFADFFNPAQRDDFQFSFRRHLFSSFS